MKVTIIGSGNIGAAIATGLLRGGSCSVTCTDRSEATLSRLRAALPALSVSADNCEAVKEADVVVLAVKPWLIKDVVSEVKNTLEYERQAIISVAAGVEFVSLADELRKEGAEVQLPPLFRLIPNTAAEMNESVNFVATYNADAEQTEAIVQLFSPTGLTLVVNERQLRNGTALASCGIAYVFRYIRACMEGGVEIGFYPSDALKIVLQTMKGAIALLEAHGSHPEAEIDKVTTPGGITIRGLNTLEANGFTNAVIKGITANAAV
jgi:pyrroline-5-carboxylate reductase